MYECLFNRYKGKNVIIDWNIIMSIIPPYERNFEHNIYLGFIGDAEKHNTRFYEHNPSDYSRNRPQVA